MTGAGILGQPRPIEEQAEVLGKLVVKCAAMISDLRFNLHAGKITGSTNLMAGDYVIDNFRVAIPGLTAHLTKFWIGRESWHNTSRFIESHCTLIERGITRGQRLIENGQHAHPDHA